MKAAPVHSAEVAAYLGAALREAAIPYAIGGAIAYGFWGDPRGTRDVDVNIFLPVERAGAALDALEGIGIQLEKEKVLASGAARGDARVFYADVPVDLFFLAIPLHESAAERTVEVTLLGQAIRILSAEDLLVLKLLFFRGKDVVDVERVVAVQGDRLDREYVRRWLIDCVGDDDSRVVKWDAICGQLPSA